MKVLISRKDLKDTTSGVPKKVLQELSFFKQRGHEAFAVAETMNFSMVEEFGGIPVKTFRWPISGHFRRKFYQKNVDRWIKKHRPHIVIGHGDILHQDVLFIHNCVHLAHELVEGKPLPLNHEVGPIHEEILTKGSYKVLICNSEMMKADLVKRFKIDPSKAVVIYPEVNLKKFAVENAAETRKKWREKFDFKEEHFIFGMITSGNFKKRNLDGLISAFAEVVKTNENARLFIAGGNLEEKYLKQMNDLGVQDKVRTAEPIIDVKNYYHLIDTFILPAHIEEFGRSVLEAMYCGKPVITTDKVGASEIMEGKAREFIISGPSIEKIFELMNQLLLDKNLCSELSLLNREVASKYNAEIQNDSFGNVLERYGILK